ncbi:MAG: hypothetical protein ABWY52_06345 [Candidatus Limnocylindrales bacterium]
MDQRPARRRLPMRLAAGLAWIIVAETLLVGTVSATGPARAEPQPADQPGTLQDFDIPARPILASGGALEPLDVTLDDVRIAGADWRLDRAAQRAADAAAAEAAAKAKAQAAAKAKPKATSEPKATSKPSKPSFKGKNHFWFPSLGINQSVYSFPCSRSKAPGNVVYRWGCAGSNNVYLMAHDFGKFYPLYKAYQNGRLKKGMLAVYAGPNGRTHYYRLSFYRVVRPDGDVGWAYASTSRSALTLQTCVSGGKMRLVVRFYEVSKP